MALLLAERWQPRTFTGFPPLGPPPFLLYATIKLPTYSFALLGTLFETNYSLHAFLYFQNHILVASGQVLKSKIDFG